MPIKDEILEALLKDYISPEDLLGKDGLLKEMTKRLLEKVVESELSHHLGNEKHPPAGKRAAIPATSNRQRPQCKMSRRFSLLFSLISAILAAKPWTR